MSDKVWSLIGAEETPSVINVERNYNTYKSLTQGKMTRIISDGTINDFPQNVFGVEQNQQFINGDGTNFFVNASTQLSNGYGLVLFSIYNNSYATVIAPNGPLITRATDICWMTGMIPFPNQTYAVSNRNHLIQLDSSRFLFVFMDNGTSGNGSGTIRACVFTVSGLSISAGGVFVLVSDAYFSSGGDFSVSMVNTDKCVLGYVNTATTRQIRALTITTSGSNISVGTAVTVHNPYSSSYSPSYVTTAKVDVDKVIFIYLGYPSTSAVTCGIVGTCSGTPTLTLGSQVTLYASSMYGFSAWQINTNVIGYVSSSSSYGYFSSVTVNGTVPTAVVNNTMLGGMSGYSYGNKPIDLGGGYYAYVGYYSGSSSIYVNTFFVNTSTGGFTAKNNTFVAGSGNGNGNSGNTNADNYYSYVYDSANRNLAIFYTDSANQYWLRCSVVKLGTAGEITVSSDIGGYNNANNYVHKMKIDNTNYSTYPGFARCSAVPFGTDKVVVLWSDLVGTTKTAKSAIVTISEMAARKMDNVLGVTQLTASGRVVLRGIPTSLSGLIPGQRYYYDRNGNITSASTDDLNLTNTYLGVALSSTEIMVKDYLF